MKDVTKGRKLIRGGLAAAGLILLLGTPAARPGARPTAQEPPPREVQKPTYDYMSGLLSRSTNPLGLKDNPAVRRMLGQGPVAWALRSGSRHVLD
jgi:hypothetical protein